MNLKPIENRTSIGVQLLSQIPLTALRQKVFGPQDIDVAEFRTTLMLLSSSNCIAPVVQDLAKLPLISTSFL